MESLDVEYVRDLVENCGLSYAEVSKECQRQRPGLKGFSARSVRRFCKKNMIFRLTRISDGDLDRVTALHVSKVGHVYGRKMMCGLLRSEGWRIGENRIGRSMKRVHPIQLENRRNEANRHINPRPYVAHFFGHKLHVDQNEKIVMFGVVHILAIDGYSGKIVSLVSMPRKNCVLIYDHMFREIVSSYGMWQQLRVDHGTEWALMLFVQNRLSHLRNDPSKAPYLQTPSTQNHIVERTWVEVNNRVNYPIKKILIGMVEREEVDIHDDHHKYCISWFTIHVCAAGLKMFVESWNAHPLPKRFNSVARGTPNDRMTSNNRVTPVHIDVLPTSSSAMDLYRQSRGTITEDYDFGVDPLKHNQEKKALRQTAFCQRFQFQTIFNTAVNGDEHLFFQGLLFNINLTHRLSL